MAWHRGPWARRARAGGCHEGAVFPGVPNQEEMLCVHVKLQVRQAGLRRARVGGKVRILSKWQCTQ